MHQLAKQRYGINPLSTSVSILINSDERWAAPRSLSKHGFAWNIPCYRFEREWQTALEGYLNGLSASILAARFRSGSRLVPITSLFGRGASGAGAVVGG